MYLSISNFNYYLIGSPLTITLNSIFNPSSLATIGKITVSCSYMGTEVTTASITLPSSTFKTDVLRRIAYEISY